jgi:hypothetical protein
VAEDTVLIADEGLATALNWLVQALSYAVEAESLRYSNTVSMIP